MKRLALLVIAMMGLFFTSCKPEPENGENNGGGNGEAGKVKVSCTIPVNKGTRSDFSTLFEDGVINWSNGRECVYLAVHGDNTKIVELEGYSDGYKPGIEFVAYVDENLLTAGESYDIWYFGHSQQLDSAYVSLVNGNKIEGSIAKQTGRLEDLGYSHIASTSVTAVMENGEVKLPLVGTLKNRMAIALLDLNAVTELYGSAVNTDYTLEYNADTDQFEFKVIENENANIEVESAAGISYVALLPNGNNKVELKCEKNGHDCEYVFFNGIKENKIYYKFNLNGEYSNLAWSGENLIDGYEFVDLGLPSGLKWATCNIGANTPEEYGNYYAWGEIEPNNYYYTSNSSTYGKQMSDISGNPKYDAATANWGGSWRMPTRSEMQELLDNCKVSGNTLVGPNGNKIYFPKAGYLYESYSSALGQEGNYWCSTSSDDDNVTAYKLYFSKNGNVYLSDGTYRWGGLSIRPVVE